MATTSEARISTEIPYQARQLLSHYGPGISALIERRLYSRVEFDGRLRWEGLFDAISEVFAELGDAPGNATDQNTDSLKISIDQHR
jgi:hypothetical protein